jgi:hypothetical protein
MTTTPKTNSPKVTKKVPVNDRLKQSLNVLYVVICVALLYKVGTTLYNIKTTNDVTKKGTSCPTLLSISRSARDTLLVMKAESLCTEYVLDNIK